MIRRTTQVILGLLTALMLVLVIGCSDDDNGTNPDPATAPVVTTAAVTDITPTTAECGGNVTSDGGAAVTARGVCWSTSPTPTTADNLSADGAGTGNFTSSISGLTAGTDYYVRAYATNSAGTGYGVVQSFTTMAPATAPVVTTAAVTDITPTTAQCGGNVTSDGGAEVTARGVCWSTSPTPTTADNISTDGSGTGSFTSSISGLTAGTDYYVRAYATNRAGTEYGSAEPFTTISTVTDVDGNVYETVTIGSQVWMAENLKVTHYRNGDPIPNISRDAAWADRTTGACCDFNNDPRNVATYGKLYNWYAVDDSRNIAPAGWHVPTDEEWKQLEIYLGMSQIQADDTNQRGTDEGGKLKEVGTTHWYSPNTGATNESGFTALPGGHRSCYGSFSDTEIGRVAYFWSSTVSDYEGEWFRILDYGGSSVSRYYFYNNFYGKLFGLSVRCVQD